MRGQIGSWDECLAVTLEDDALAWLDACGCDRRVLIDVDKTARVVTVMPDESGHRVCHRGMRNAVLHGVTLDWRLVNGPPLPRFELMPISLDATDGVALEIGCPRTTCSHGPACATARATPPPRSPAPSLSAG